jgi:predicted ATPase/DNA-binding SARP family transcriptional activator/tetratricopeptide (TPR) repeat protein
VRWRGADVALPNTRPAALLAYLACVDRWVSRDELALLFRPDATDAEARAYLRKLVFRARRLGWSQGLELHEERVRWRVETDLAALRAAAAAGDWATVAACDASRPLLDGLRLVQAPAFDAWLEGERESVALLWRRGLSAHAAALEAAGDRAGAALWRERLLEHEPLDESTLQDLMRVLESLGEPARGIAAYEAFVTQLEREVGVQPLEATQALADALRAAAARPSQRRTEARLASPTTFGLPQPSTSFVGREDELARLAQWVVEEHAKVVTVVGLGGVGKSRLALEAAARLAPRLAGGVAYVELGALSEGADALEVVATRLRVPPRSGVDVAERLATHFAEQDLLLVLDEAERFVAGALPAQLARLVAAAPRLRVVVTSRVPLGLASERLLDVHGLAAPPAGRVGVDPRHYDAVQLLVQRASRAHPDFVLDDADAEAAGALARAVGGHPLALELAAAWTRGMSVAAILAELRAGHDLLRSGAADVPARHRSVRVLIDGAWQGLQDPERSALAKLCVFRGACTLAAARAVAGAGLDTVLTLLERSLLRRTGSDRYEVHELVRRGSPLAIDDAVHDAHARYMLTWLAALGDDLRGRDQARAVLEVHAALPDVTAAWDHAAARGWVDVLSAALDALDYALHLRSMWRAAAARYQAALAGLASIDGAAGAALRVRVETRLANLERNLGDSEAARRRLQRALAEATALGHARARLEARLELARLDEAVGAYTAATHGYREVLADAIGEDDDLRAGAHTGLGNVLFALGRELDEAMRHYQKALATARRIGDVDTTTIALINLGAGHYDLGQEALAGRCWQEAAELSHVLGNTVRAAAALHNLGALAERRGDVRGARESFERALALRQEVGDRRGAGRVLLSLGRLTHAEGSLAEADAYLEAAVASFERFDEPAYLAFALASHGRVRAHLGDLQSAGRMTERALRLARAAGDHIAMLAGLLSRATVDLHQGRAAAARRLAADVARHARGRAEGVLASALSVEAEAAAELGGGAVRAMADGDGVPPRVEVLVDRALRAV